MGYRPDGKGCCVQGGGEGNENLVIVIEGGGILTRIRGVVLGKNDLGGGWVVTVADDGNSNDGRDGNDEDYNEKLCPRGDRVYKGG